MVHILRTALGILLGMLGTISICGSVFIIPISDGNLPDCIAVWIITIAIFALAMVTAPWLF